MTTKNTTILHPSAPSPVPLHPPVSVAAARHAPGHRVPSAISPITEDDITEFLLQTPEFFERHAELLGTVQIMSPHGNRAVSLQQRQAEMLRDKIKALEQRTMDMVRHSNDNNAIAHKVHQWGCALQRATPAAALPDALLQSLQDLFGLPQVALRLWDLAPAHQDGPHTQGASSDVRAFAASLTAPFGGPNRGFEAVAWLPDSASVQSLALLPLRDGAIDSATPAFGLLVLGSPDAGRFEPDMGTDFLVQMAEVASAALSRMR